MRVLPILAIATILAGCATTPSSNISMTAIAKPSNHISAGCLKLASGQVASFKSSGDGILTFDIRQGISLIELDAGGNDAVEIERSLNAETGAMSYFAELDRGDSYQLNNNSAGTLRYCFLPEK